MCCTLERSSYLLLAEDCQLCTRILRKSHRHISACCLQGQQSADILAEAGGLDAACGLLAPETPRGISGPALRVLQSLLDRGGPREPAATAAIFAALPQIMRIMQVRQIYSRRSFAASSALFCHYQPESGWRM